LQNEEDCNFTKDVPVVLSRNLQQVAQSKQSKIQTMKKTSFIPRVLAFAAVAACACVSSTFANGYTNVVQHLNLQLTYLTQGPYKTNSPATNDISATAVRTAVTTKDVIGWLGTATTNNFPATASLVRVKHFNAATNFTTFEVRYGTNNVDVSALFAETASSEKIDASIYNKVTKLSTGKQFEVLHLTLTNAAPYNLVPYFRVQGMATMSYVSALSGKTHLTADTILAPAIAGPGATSNGTPALVFGSAAIIGTTTEVK
jgi:hypothetical protein